jgi:hypothetical protein
MCLWFDHLRDWPRLDPDRVTARRGLFRALLSVVAISAGQPATSLDVHQR